MFFKTVEDAARLRLRISECFERAALPQTSPEARARGMRPLGGWRLCRPRAEGRGLQAAACCLLPRRTPPPATLASHSHTPRSPRLPPSPHPRPQERKKLLSFVIVGGGPTGVEVAAELHDLITDDLVKLYPEQVGARGGCSRARAGSRGQRRAAGCHPHPAAHAGGWLAG